MRSTAAPETFFEALEPRLALDGSPLPTLAMLEDPDHGVVRLSTAYGDIDLELFHDEAPATTAAFLSLVSAGKYAGTFFHSADGVRLRGGIDRFDGEALSARAGTLAVDSAPTRSNLAQTISLPVDLSGPTPQTTGEIVFNLADNSAADTEYAVFGRVIQGWSVVVEIGKLSKLDLSGFFPGDPIGQTLTQVPVTDSDPLPTAVTPSLLVTIGEASIIKPQNVPAFYTERLYFPEGYSWERTFESVELLNRGNESSSYQIVVRYEAGERDQVVGSGELAPQRRRSVVIAPGFGQPSSIVRNNEAYAYEVWSTTPLVAGFRHKDFKAGVGESFFRPASLPDQDAMLEWSFFQAALGFNTGRAFIPWQNTTGSDAHVTVTFYFTDSGPVHYDYTTAPHRRGGVNILELEGIPAGAEFLGAKVTSDQPIVASITRYDQRSGGNNGDEGGIAALGVPGGGAPAGVTPGAARGGTDPLAILNTSDQDATITFYVAEEGSVTPVLRSATVPAGRLLVLSGSDNPATSAQHGQFYSIRYSSNTPVTVGFVTSAFRGTGTAAAVFSARTTSFADARAFTAPRSAPFGQQSLSIYNPGPDAATITIVFSFADHDPVAVPVFTLASGDATHRKITEYASLLAQALGGLGGLTQSPYSITVSSDEPVVAQTSQLNSDGRTELGMTLETWIPVPTVGP